MSLDYAAAYHCHCSIELNAGVSITLKSLTQKLTYGGLLDGIPTAKINRDLIHNIIECLEASGSKPLLIQPGSKNFLRQPGDMDSIRFGRPAADWLPMITCIGEFHSSLPVRSPNMDASCLTVVWFQDEFAMPVSETVLESIKCIDWSVQASDYEC
ncbi:MAG: hypothetical protein U1F71_10000 [Verrucomicrobiaceae bacterium]